MNQIDVGAWLLRVCLVLMVGQIIYTVPVNAAQTNYDITLTNNLNITTAPIEIGKTSVPETKYLIPGAELYARSFGIDEARRLAATGVIIGQNSMDGCIDLIKGNILINQDKNIAVCFNEGKIYVGASSTVFLMRSDDGIIIYDLLQTKPKQVFIVIDAQKLFVEPGQLLVLTKHKAEDFEKLPLNCCCIDYRNAKPLHLSKINLQAYTAEFSITSALVTSEPLKRLLVSDDKHDKSTLEKLIKHTVILQGGGNNTL